MEADGSWLHGQLTRHAFPASKVALGTRPAPPQKFCAGRCYLFLLRRDVESLLAPQSNHSMAPNVYMYDREIVEITLGGRRIPYVAKQLYHGRIRSATT